MTIAGVFKHGFRVTTKASALEFYKCLKSVNLIPYDAENVIRVEPGQHISVIPRLAVIDGHAWLIPAIYDEDGSMAYEYRKYINAWLRDM